MEESEELTALKKAYADMILNTTNDAAIKMMISERKVHRCQFDNSVVKEQALRFLFRFKQTMDVKLNDLETKSQNQQRRIEELEAQLRKAEDRVCNQLAIKLYWQLNDLEMKAQHQQRKIEELEAQLEEAEDIVGDLREELHAAHMRLEKLENNQMHCRPNMMEYTVCEEGMAELENELPEAVLASQSKGLNNPVNGHCVANNSSDKYGYAGVPDVPSTVVRSKTSELYKNGCTQMVQTYEGNQLNGHFSLSSESGNHKNEKTLIEDKEGKRIYMNPSIDANIACISGEMPVGNKEVKYVKSSCYNRALISFCKRRKRRNKVTDLNPVSPVSKEVPSSLWNSQTCLAGTHNKLDSVNNEDKCTQSISPLTTSSIVSEMRSLSKHVAVVRGGDEFAEAHTDALDDDREVGNRLVLTRQQNGSRDCLGVPSSNPETKTKNFPSANLEPKVLDTSEGFPSLQPRERVLKYTFQRKRKKEALSSDNSSLLRQENSSKRTIEKKQNGACKPFLSRTVAKPSRDSWGMTQMAHQLILLSENKW